MSIADYLLLSWIQEERKFLSGSVIEETWRFGDLQIVEMLEDDVASLEVVRGYSSISRQPSVAVITSEYSSTDDIHRTMEEIFDQDLPVQIIILTDDNSSFRLKTQQRFKQIPFFTYESMQSMKSIKDSQAAVLFLTLDQLTQYIPPNMYVPPPSTQAVVETNNNRNQFSEFVSCARRPVLVLGVGTRHEHKKQILAFRMPVVVVHETLDLIPGNNRYFMGRVGMDGDRAGNFTLQNADLVVFLGTVRFREKHSWMLREAHSVSIPTENISLFLSNTNFQPTPDHITRWQQWYETCRHWRSRWMSEMPRMEEDHQESSSLLHPYLFHALVQECLSSTTKTIVGGIDTSWWYPLYQQTILQEEDRFLATFSASVLPLAIGALSTLSSDDNRTILIFMGEKAMLRFQDLTALYEFISNSNSISFIRIVCMNPTKSDLVLQLDENGYLAPISSVSLSQEGGESYTLSDLSEISGLEAEVRSVSAYEDIMDLFHTESRIVFIDAHVTDQFTPTPRGRADKPLEIMEPLLPKNDMEIEMLIQPIMLD